jgi:hypothetical protein
MIQGALISAPVVSRHGIFSWLLRTILGAIFAFDNYQRMRGLPGVELR